MGEIDHPRSIAGQISNRRIELNQGYVHFAASWVTEHPLNYSESAMFTSGR